MKIKKYQHTPGPISRATDELVNGVRNNFTDSFLPVRIKDFARRYIFSNRDLGRYVPYKDSQGWHPDINGKGFGKVIGEGSEQTVYENLDNPNVVLKMLDISYPTKSALRAGVKQYNKRNLIPLQERAKFLGYVKGPNNAGTQEAYYPIFSQKKLTIPTDKSWTTWESEYLPQIEYAMRNLGISGGNGIYNYKGYKISNLSPDNIGFDENGNLRLIDAYVDKQGGILRRK